jgi:hypothetical protein
MANGLRDATCFDTPDDVHGENREREDGKEGGLNAQFPVVSVRSGSRTAPCSAVEAGGHSQQSERNDPLKNRHAKGPTFKCVDYLPSALMWQSFLP